LRGPVRDHGARLGGVLAGGSHEPRPSSGTHRHASSSAAPVSRPSSTESVASAAWALAILFPRVPGD
jgi:hypothetical protein